VPSLVEKAYAKACTIRVHAEDADDVMSGGWMAIAGGGRVDDALVDLTGGVASSFSTRDISPDRLFIYLFELQRDCLFVCRVDVENCGKHGVGLNPFASHAVNRAAHLEGRCFVQVFCASREGVHSAGLEEAVPDELMHTYPERAAEGFFWLDIHDFHYYFNTIFECRLTNSPDVGIEMMPPSRLPNACSPSQGLPLKPAAEMTWTPGARGQDVLAGTRSSQAGAMHQRNDWPAVQPGRQRWMHEELLSPGMSTPAMPASAHFPHQVPGMPLSKPLEERPLFFECVFANNGTVSEHRPPEFDVVLPNLPCEVVACVEQTCPRVQQVGRFRNTPVAILLKVYEHIVSNTYASECICRSGWMPVRGAMVAFKSVHGGHFKIIGEMLDGEHCDRLIMRCYTSVSSATVTASNGAQKHLLAKRKRWPNAIKWSFVGCAVPRVDLPMAPEEDLDMLRRRHGRERCCVM